MSWPTYPAHKHSGTAWLGQIPAHWELRPLGYFFTERKTTVNDKDFQPLSVTKSGIVPQLDTAAKTDHGDSRKLVKAGDFVINSRSDRKGSSGLSPLDGSVSVISTVLKPRAILGRYAHHLLRSQAFQEEYYRFGSGIVADLWSTRYSAMKAIVLPAPPTDEQVTISAFVDRETAKIDALIAKQEQLIATLREDRTATISHAVTKGLDRGVQYKAMGIDLPDVPNHWQVQPIKHLGRLVTGRTPDTSEEGHYSGVHDGFPWFRPEDLDTTGKPSTASRWISESGWATVPHLPAPSVHVVSIGATLGKIGYVEKKSSSNQQITALVGASCPRFLYFALVASYEQIWASSMGNTIPIISAGRLGAIKVPVPPEEEQRTIVAYLNEFCCRVDSLILKAREVVLTLQEYRSALITDAVTGKIDVRGVA